MLILLLVLVIASCAAGVAVAVMSLRAPKLDPASPQAAKSAARVVERAGRAIDAHRSPGWRRFVRQRLDHRVATGLLLTVGVAIVVLFVVLVAQVRADSGVVSFDHTAEQWADGHATAFSNDVIGAITDLGGDLAIIAIGVAVLIADWVRSRSFRAAPFLLAVMVGQSVLTNLVKAAVGRGRPALGLLHGLDPSFPSGHSASAAATFAACALVLGLGRSRRTQAILTGTAVALAVAVASSRVMLGVHWFSDVVAGLALGWAWFAICALAFGGRLLRFGAPVKIAERHQHLVDAASPT